MSRHIKHRCKLCHSPAKVMGSSGKHHTKVFCTNYHCGLQFRVAHTEHLLSVTVTRSGKGIVKGRYQPEFKELHRDPFFHMKLALLGR